MDGEGNWVSDGTHLQHSCAQIPLTEHLPFLWRGHRLKLLGARAVWDPTQRLLLVADLHLGKAESFQAHGVPLPSDGDASTLNA